MIIVGTILAGGRSSRMGEEKATLLLGGIPILQHVINRISPQVASLGLNVMAESDHWNSFQLPQLPDLLQGHQGPLAGILTALAFARKAGASHLLSVPCDSPFLPHDLVTRLKEPLSKNPHLKIINPLSDGQIHPVIGLWNCDLYDSLYHALTVENIRKIDRWSAAHPCATMEWGISPYDPFLNLNRKEDIEEAEAILRRESL